MRLRAGGSLGDSTPLPIANLRHVLATLVDILLVLDELVLDHLLEKVASLHPASAVHQSRSASGATGPGHCEFSKKEIVRGVKPNTPSGSYNYAA